MPQYEVVDLGKPAKDKTFMLYGESGAGKTWLLGTFPRALIIADKSEHGWTTIEGMDKSLFYEADRRPTVWGVSNHKQYLEAISDFKSLNVKEPGRFQTLGTDSLTFYADSYYSSLEMAAWEERQKRPEGRVLYGDLGSHLRYLMLTVHEIPHVHKVWTALAKPPDDGKEGGLLLAGQTKDKAPARCDYWLYLRQSGGNFEVRTKSYGPYPARCRVGSKQVPDPLPESTFRCFEKQVMG